MRSAAIAATTLLGSVVPSPWTYIPQADCNGGVPRAGRRSQLLSDFGTRVRLARGRLGVSQEELADRAGLDRTYISGIERGRENLTLLNLCRLAEGLQADPGGLVAGLRLGGAEEGKGPDAEGVATGPRDAKP